MQPNHAVLSSESLMNVGQGSMPSPLGTSSVLRANAVQNESHVQNVHGTCPQHPHHVHHPGHHHPDLAAVQMAMASNPGGQTQQSSTVIFAAAPPGHQVAVPVIAGFPPAPNLQLHSGVPQPVMALPPGHQPYPHPLAQAQGIHIHNHQGHSFLPNPNQQGSNIHVLQSAVHPHQICMPNNQSNAQANFQQEFTDPAIMSVSKIPPPRASNQQNGSNSSFPTNIMQMNSKVVDTTHSNVHKPIIPASSNVKSVQDLEREMMAGPTVKKTHNNQQQNNVLNQQHRPHGQIHNRPGYNANQLPRQNHIGMRNNQPYQVDISLILYSKH